MEQEPSFIDFREVLWKARRYKWLALFPFVLIVCAAWIYLMITTPLYESTVVVSVDDNAPVTPALGNLVQQDRSEESRRQRAQRVDSRIHSRVFLESIVNRMGYAKDPEFMYKAAGAAHNWKGITTEEYAVRLAVLYLGRKIVVTPSADTRVRIAALDRDPRVARTLAGMIADELIAENKAKSIQKATERGEFSSDQIAIYEERLRKSEDALRNHQQAMIGNTLTSNPIRDDNFETAKEQISDARNEMDQIRARLQTDLSAWEDAAAGIALDRAELRSLKNKEQRLMALTSDYSRRAQSKPAQEIESERLRSEVETNRDLLLALKKEATSSRISAALETSAMGMAFDILEAPQLPLTPVYPHPFRVMGTACFMGPLLGIGLASVAERLGAALGSC